jgi:hypothetical protein
MVADPVAVGPWRGSSVRPGGAVGSDWVGRGAISRRTAICQSRGRPLAAVLPRVGWEGAGTASRGLSEPRWRPFRPFHGRPTGPASRPAIDPVMPAGRGSCAMTSSSFIWASSSADRVRRSWALRATDSSHRASYSDAIIRLAAVGQESLNGSDAQAPARYLFSPSACVISSTRRG